MQYVIIFMIFLLTKINRMFKKKKKKKSMLTS